MTAPTNAAPIASIGPSAERGIDTPNPTVEAPAQPAKDAQGNTVMSAEAWATKKKTPHWQFRSAQCAYHWGIGHELTEAAYDQAIADASNAQLK